MKGRAELDVYEEWRVALPLPPPHSILYALEPVGVGTPLVESLTSYIVRLAEAHGVLPGILMEKMVVPCIRESHVVNAPKLPPFLP